MYDAAELSQLPALLAVELASIGRALASTTRENICAILDAAIVRATISESLACERLENMLFAEHRANDVETERDAAQNSLAQADKATAIATALAEGYQQHAEVVEARAAELQAALDEARGGMEIHRAISDAANRRVAELEAEQLNPWDTAPIGERVTVTLRTEGWRTDEGLWEWDDNGNWEVVGWEHPAPAD